MSVEDSSNSEAYAEIKVTYENEFNLVVTEEVAWAVADSLQSDDQTGIKFQIRLNPFDPEKKTQSTQAKEILDDAFQYYRLVMEPAEGLDKKGPFLLLLTPTSSDKLQYLIPNTKPYTEVNYYLDRPFFNCLKVDIPERVFQAFPGGIDEIQAIVYQKVEEVTGLNLHHPS